MIRVENIGEPIRLTDLNFAGVSAEAARGGGEVEIWTRMALTSDQQLFHKIVGYLASAIEYNASLAGRPTKISRAHTVLLVLRPDNTGELWVDTAAVCAYSALKRPGSIAAGTPLFESDVADVTGMWFPCVEIDPQDRILCIFREGWRFGLYFDFNPDGELAIEDAKRILGTLLRRMRYADFYDAMAHEPTFKRLVAAGWFPFLELLGAEFKTLLAAQESGFGLEDAEAELIGKFDEARVDRMFTRWMERPHLKAKEVILTAATRAFKAEDPVSVIKNVLSEIEGVMSQAYFEAMGERTHRIPKLLHFMISAAEKRAGGKDTLFFPAEFGRYLKDYTYSGFSPGDVRSAGSRHAVGHGAVAGEEYTMARALQAMLTLDQLAFYS